MVKFVKYNFADSYFIKEKNDTNDLTFCFFITNNKVDELIVAFYSLCRNNKFHKNILIISDDLTDDSIALIVKKMRKFDCFIYFINVFQIKNKFYKERFWPQLITKKFILLHKSFRHFGSILCLDTDIIINKKCNRIFKIGDDFLFKAIKDPISYTDKKVVFGEKMLKNTGFSNFNSLTIEDYFELNGIDKKNYYNGGVINYNVKHSTFNLSQIKKLINRSSYYVLLEQDLFNIAFKKSIYNVDTTYNLPSSLFKYSDRKKIHIIHYTGEGKPWHKKGFVININWSYVIWSWYALCSKKYITRALIIIFFYPAFILINLKIIRKFLSIFLRF